jgi:hypothetical protein
MESRAMNNFYHAIRGCRELPVVGPHPANATMAMFVMLGALAGIGISWKACIVGVALMLLFLGPLYLWGAVARSKMAWKDWRHISPAEAGKHKLDLSKDLSILAPINELGERCPWPWEPQQLVNAPLGQYHCSYCGGMQCAGVPHIDWSDFDEAEYQASMEATMNASEGPAGDEWVPADWDAIAKESNPVKGIDQ